MLVRDEPNNPPPSTKPELRCATCEQFGTGLNVTNLQGSKSMSTWESGNDIHHLLVGRNAVAASETGGKGGMVPDNSGFVQHYKFENTSLDLVQEQQGSRQNQTVENCDAETYDSAS